MIETIETLARRFIGRTDDLWDIEESEDGAVFRVSGRSAVECTGYADRILTELGPHRVEIVGYFDSDNPGSEVGRLAGGHDFAVVDGRFIVDPWITDVVGTGDRGVYDLLDPGDEGEIRRLYGGRERWKRTTSTLKSATLGWPWPVGTPV